MALKLDIKTGEKMVVNGAVIENVGPSAKILVHNMASILREKEILSQEEARTPASRVYFALQCAYMFPQNPEDHLRTFRSLLADYLSACPSANDVGEEITTFVDASDYYKALRASRKLIAHEVSTLDAFNSDMTKLSAIAAGAGDDDEDDQISSIQDEKELLNDT